MTPYCSSRFVSIRRKTREVKVGNVGVGGSNPIRIQSMTTTVTMDVEATVKQARALVDAGCEIVRITAPNVKSSQALAEISKRLHKDKIDVPLVADIHFLPSAAMEAVEHVEKVRINPGNYADKKKFQVREYSDSEYNLELEKLFEAFSPLVLRCKELGRSMRIGTNHGSLSDRIMNRFGDSPLGMVESALEFIRIAESHDYKDIILSMKASNPKVMIQAYRLVVANMNKEGMNYPLHLGVTEAGDGEDGRIKSTIGIGSLLIDGLGDTIRVSLTEDPVYEIPVAQALAEKTMRLWQQTHSTRVNLEETIDAYSFRRRPIQPLVLKGIGQISSNLPPRVFIKPGESTDVIQSIDQLIDLEANNQAGETPVEGWVINLQSEDEAQALLDHVKTKSSITTPLVLEIGSGLGLGSWVEDLKDLNLNLIPAVTWENLTKQTFQDWAKWSKKNEFPIALGINADQLTKNALIFLSIELPKLLIFLPPRKETVHAVGQYRMLSSVLDSMGYQLPIWIRGEKKQFLQNEPGFLNDLLETSLMAGSLLSDGIGDVLSVESIQDPKKALSLAYNVLQGAGSRISKTEYVACPSCGRTLFDLQKTTQIIRQETNHLKGVKIAVMGCIVNGPGEMADADFGYVGGAPGKVNLYIGKDCIEYHVPEDEAVNRLISLIKHEGRWTDPIIP
ncbi:MAG: (E)-4-hydroxy-3-methylbut-2-enyl-diphosphate synthase [Verrucomicrobia bacterium]|nr:(E)-4-hydroxy-3-methylbut-2-enyl-diphosphate synthase [Verrucomicrobiota bacterium]